jgi:ABC-type Na+ transport system ATPase subunit NatA
MLDEPLNGIDMTARDEVLTAIMQGFNPNTAVMISSHLIEDLEKRLIHISVTQKKNFVLIQVNNYCETSIRIKNGYPVTTKADKSSHGFGIKSIRYTVEKYNGTLTFDLNKNWFELKILIPQAGAS